MEQLACLRVEQKCAEVNTFVVLQAVTFALPSGDLAEYLKCLDDPTTPEIVFHCTKRCDTGPW